MGQDQSGEKISLFMEDWELARAALSCHRALDLLCQEIHEAWLLGCCHQEACCLTARSAFSHRGRAVTKGEGCGERQKKKKRNVSDRLKLLLYKQKVGRRVEHHLSKRDRCGQKEGFSLLSRMCAVIFSSHRRSSAGDVLLLAQSHVACVSSQRKIEVNDKNKASKRDWRDRKERRKWDWNGKMAWLEQLGVEEEKEETQQTVQQEWEEVEEGRRTWRQQGARRGKKRRFNGNCQHEEWMDRELTVKETSWWRRQVEEEMQVSQNTLLRDRI